MIRVLIAPLDWGLGHATRCIPLIRGFIDRKAEVMLAGNGDSLALLRKEFPGLKAFDLPGYDPHYPDAGLMLMKMIAQVPKFLSVIRKEHKFIEEIVASQKIDLVVSDNRYGCWSEKVPSIFVTHQTNIIMSRHLGLKRWVNRYNARLIKRFTECWIPDFPGHHSLAGKLVRTEKSGLHRFRFIGNLSRFEHDGSDHPVKYDVVALLSGPEPQRTLLENILVPQLIKSGLRYFVVRGIVHPVVALPSSVPAADYMTSSELQSLLLETGCVVARSGYSTVMDLAKLRKKAILIPTPGQTEQEYIGNRLMKMRIALCASQRGFDLAQALKRSKAYIGFDFTADRFNLLNTSLDETFANLFMMNRVASLHPHKK